MHVRLHVSCLKQTLGRYKTLLVSARSEPDLEGMHARGVAGLRLIGGHPALDLVNTVSARRGRIGSDYLATYDDLLLWASRQGVLAEAEASTLRAMAQAGPASSGVALERLRSLREGIWRIWVSKSGGAAADLADLGLLTDEVAAAQQVRSLAWTGDGCGWHWTEAAGFDAVTARVAVAAAELLVGQHLHRVRECGGRNCGWLFLDTTRNGTRRWCSSEECGSLARVTRFRANRKTRKDGTPSPQER